VTRLDGFKGDMCVCVCVCVCGEFWFTGLAPQASFVSHKHVCGASFMSHQ
jgi:NADH:ubiquinone oxidoreductase subunit 5 (subunit L)/multisubunit Na+/H+ antiporter MnhA subunit